MSSSPAANRRANRQPWVTYGLLLLCAIGWVTANQRERDVRGAAEAALDTAAAYWTEHPYLEPADVVAERLGAEAIARRRAEFERARVRSRSVRIPKPLRSDYQEKLDALTAGALAPLAQMPRYRMGVRASKPDAASYMTHIFLHGSWLHLIGNGIWLLILGFAIERVWGSAVFAVLVPLFALAAATAFRIGNPALNASLIGTSGLIAGLLGVFAVRFASRWTQASYWAVVIGGLCWLMLPARFGLDGSLVPGPAADGETTLAAAAGLWAVAGGLACGVALAVLVKVARIEEILSGSDTNSDRKPSLEPDLEAALEARADGRWDEAFERLASLLQQRPDYRAALLAMWEVALEMGRTAEASRAMLQIVREEVRRNAPAAVDHWLDLAGRGLHADAEPALLIHIALMLHEAEYPIEALRALEQALEISAASDSSDLAASVARASRSLDRGLAEAAAWRALGAVDLAFQERQNLEHLLGELYREQPRSDLDMGGHASTPAASFGASAAERLDVDPRAGDSLLQWDDSESSDEKDLDGEAAFAVAGPARELRGSEESTSPLRPAPIDLEIRSRELRVVRAVPIELLENGIVVAIEGSGKRKIAFDRVDAIAVAAVEGLGARFVIVLDLVLNWGDESRAPLKVIRLRGDQFDPRQFVPGAESALDAMRALTTQLLARTGGAALPDVRSVQGSPFAAFGELAEYQRTVLSIEEDLLGSDPGA